MDDSWTYMTWILFCTSSSCFLWVLISFCTIQSCCCVFVAFASLQSIIASCFPRSLKILTLEAWNVWRISRIMDCTAWFRVDGQPELFMLSDGMVVVEHAMRGARKDDWLLEHLYPVELRSCIAKALCYVGRAILAVKASVMSHTRVDRICIVLKGS